MSPSKTAIVITSIAAPNAVLREFASGSLQRDISFIVIGDRPSPADFELEGCEFYSLAAQKQLEFHLVANLPERHYARKNLGYLLAIQAGVDLILESDDDNYPLADFWKPRHRQLECPVFVNQNWVNIYAYFSDGVIWPRGFPLELLQHPQPDLGQARVQSVCCPIQQGLADDNPDVDAVFRLTRSLPYTFLAGRQLALGSGSWCPFNSQNTAFFREAFALLYLPSYCSFRMTDIWRSFVAQRIAWVNGWSVLFESPTVRQDRNDHNLLKDFQDEIPGYLNNARICAGLQGLDLLPGSDHILDNLRRCYEFLVQLQVIGPQELPLVEAWIRDIQTLTTT